MTSGAIVLIPTHDHAALLAHSIASARRQTIEDLEIVVIGDAVGDDTRDLLASLMPEDDRITFLDLPKSGRTGELHRHRVLTESTRPIVVYLSDDDLLLANHVESVTAALVDHDVVFSLPMLINEHGSIAVEPIDLSDTSWTRMVADGDRSLLSLTGFAHTLKAYLRLPFGWRDTPTGHFTDEWMYRQVFSQSWVRATTAAPTALRLPSVLRIGVGIDERLAELAIWSERLSTLNGVESLLMEVDQEIRSSASNWRRWALDANDLLALERNHSDSLVSRVADADARHAMAIAERDRLGSEAAELRARLTSSESDRAELREHYVAMTNERDRETRRAEVAESLVAAAPSRRLISLVRRVRRSCQRWFGSSGRGTST